MHKGLLISGFALVLAGCATSQSEAPPVQIDDLSAERAASTPAEYTVKSGDTLYGIAWRHDMDYRDLAEMNNISPPYSIQPGQRLALGGKGTTTQDTTSDAAAGRATQGNGGEGAVATGVAAAGAAVASGQDGSTSSGDDGSMDWLLPAGSGAADGSAGASEAETTGAGSDVPGPVYADSESSSDESGAIDDASSADEEADDSTAAEASEPTNANAARESDEADQATESSAQDSASSSANQATASDDSSQDDAPRSYTPVDPVPWQWPTDGKVVGAYGEGDSITDGIDISGQKGQPVKAAGPGIVVYAGGGVRGYGKLILLKHNDQFLSAYAHNDTLNVKENDVVQAGEVIATMGDSDAQDVRLHFEVRKDGQPQDPQEYLPGR